MTVIDVTGPITLGEPTHNLRQNIGAALQEGTAKILLNLAEVKYMDSAGIGMLLAGTRDAKAKGCSLKLLHLDRRVQDLLSITKVITLFECFSDETAAIASFS